MGTYQWHVHPIHRIHMAIISTMRLWRHIMDRQFQNMGCHYNQGGRPHRLSTTMGHIGVNRATVVTHRNTMHRTADNSLNTMVAHRVRLRGPPDERLDLIQETIASEEILIVVNSFGRRASLDTHPCSATYNKTIGRLIDSGSA
jgi:hypothetical protein